MITLRAVFLLALAVISPIAVADTSAVLTIGASRDASAAHVGVQLPLQPEWSFLRSEKISTVLEFSLGQWKGHSPNRDNNRLIDAAVLPAIRYHPNGDRQQGFFVEAGIGAHLLSRDRIHEDRRFGTTFQFGDLIGMGWRFGAGGRYEAGLRYQHVSNGGIKQPNQGNNFRECRFVASF